MFWPVTSRALRCAQRDVVAAFSPEKVLLTWTPRWRSSYAFARLRCPSVNSQARSQSTVQRDGAVRAVVGATGRAVRAGAVGLDRHQGVADGGESALDELAVGVGEAAQVG